MISTHRRPVVSLLTAAAAITLILPLVRVEAASTVTSPRTQTSASLDVAPKDAKTVEVTMITWRVRTSTQGGVGTLQAIRKSVVRIDRNTNRAKYEEFAVPQGFLGAVEMFDGTNTYEYLVQRKQYQKTAGGNLTSGLIGGMYHIALGLSLGWKSAVPEEFKSGPTETLNGQTLQVYSRTYPVKNGDEVDTYQQKFYVEASTKLPVRYSLYITDSNKKTREVSRATLSDWKLDNAIDPALLTWTPPEGATEYKAPDSSASPTPRPDVNR